MMNYFAGLLLTMFLFGVAATVTSAVNTAKGELGQGYGMRSICITSEDDFSEAKSWMFSSEELKKGIKGDDGRYSLFKLFAFPFECGGKFVGLHINKINNEGKDISKDEKKITFADYKKVLNEKKKFKNITDAGVKAVSDLVTWLDKNSDT